MAPGLDFSGAAAPSPDLRDMATLQLGMLYQLLSRSGHNYSSMRCTVYARTFTDVGPGQVKLTRVAQFPLPPGHNEELQAAQQSTLLLHTEQSWALQGGSAAVDPSGLIEDCLLHREVVALPSSSALVFPLVDGSVLVGLLVVELDPEREAGPQAGGQGGQGAGVGAQKWGSAASDVAAAAAAASGGGLFGGGPATAAGGAAALLPALCTAREMQMQRNGASGGGGLVGAAAAGGGGAAKAGQDAAADSGVEMGRAGWGPRCLTDEELRCLRLAVPLLSKACGMDARTSWQLAQSSLAAAAARGLLREAQRPLSTLNTFSSMLVPRLKDGEPDKDMAKGILLQGKRLQDLVWQLEEALHGPAAHTGSDAAMAMPRSPPSVTSTSTATTSPFAGAMTAPPFRTPGALPRDPSPAVQELLQLPPPRPVALPPSAAPDQPHRPTATAAATPPVVMASVGDAASPNGVAAAAVVEASTGAGPAPVHPGRVTFVDRSASSASSSSSPSSSLDESTASTSTAFTIRQPPGTGAAAAARPAGSDGSASTISRPFPHVSMPPPPGAAMATIDVETEGGLSGKGSSKGSSSGGGGALQNQTGIALSDRGGVAAGGGAWGWGPGQAASQLQLAAALSTNLVSALAGVLTAACRLAAVSGIGFIVSSPLSSVLPRRSSNSAASGGTRGAGAAARPRAATAGDKDKQSQLPAAAQPARPAPALSAAGAAAADLDSVVAGPRLIPRPARPLLVGVRAALVQKVVGYMLDICLQSTPRGGQLCVSARQDGSGVQLVLLHTGRMDLQRLHVRSRSLMTAAAGAGGGGGGASGAAAASPMAAAAAAVGAVMGGGMQQRSASGGAAVALAPAAAGCGGGGGNSQSGSGVLSVEMAQELAQQAGGHLTVSYPYNMVNAQSGSLDVGTSVEIWLPGPVAYN